MDNWRNITYGIGRSVALGAGLLGLYLFHKKRIPEFMGFVSSGVACASIYAWTTYFFEKTGDENKENLVTADEEASTENLVTADEEASTENLVTADEEASTENLVTADEEASTANLVTADEEASTANLVTADEEASTANLMTAEEFAIKRRNRMNKFMEESDKLLEDMWKKDRRFIKRAVARSETIEHTYLNFPSLKLGDEKLFTVYLAQLDLRMA